jgi:hypothetical protein
MKDFRLRDEARKVRESAAAAASDLARQAGEKADALKAKATDVTEQFAEQASEMSDLGVTKLNGVAVEIGLVPSVAVKFGRAPSGPRLEEPDQNAPTITALPASTAVANPA